MFLARRIPIYKVPVQGEDEDEDVAAERQRVVRGDASGDLVQLDNLTKVRLCLVFVKYCSR